MRALSCALAIFVCCVAAAPRASAMFLGRDEGEYRVEVLEVIELPYIVVRYTKIGDPEETGVASVRIAPRSSGFKKEPSPSCDASINKSDQAVSAFKNIAPQEFVESAATMMFAYKLVGQTELRILEDIWFIEGWNALRILERHGLYCRN